MNARRKVQLVSLGLLHCSWGPDLKWLCNPVLSCHSCALSWFACPIGVFVHYSGFHLFPYLAAGTVLLAGVLVGRTMCGWVCPFGLLQDVLHELPGPKIRLPGWLGWLRYVVLVLTVFLAPWWLGADTAWSFCRVCPASALQVTVPGLLSGGLASASALAAVKLSVLVGILALATLSSRAFCRVICPIGALLSPLNHVSFRVVDGPDACSGCGRCDLACPTQSEPSARAKDHVPPGRSAGCIACDECRTVCAGRRDHRVSR